MDAETLEFWAQFARLDIDPSRQPYRSNRQALVLFSSGRMRDTQCIDMLSLMVRCLLLVSCSSSSHVGLATKVTMERIRPRLGQVVNYASCRTQCSSPGSDGSRPQSIRPRNSSQVSISACLDQTTIGRELVFCVLATKNDQLRLVEYELVGHLRHQRDAQSLRHCFCCSSRLYRVL
jgi:hypothetical protein